MRRRAWLLLSGTLVVAALLVVTTALAGATRQVKVASGSFRGVPWTLRAHDSEDGSWCMSLSLAGTATSTCDKLDLSDAGRSMNSFGHAGRPGPDFWTGPITWKAKRVVLTYTDGRRVSVPTIPATSGLVRKVSFYVFLTPCRTPAPKSIAGLDGSGHVVALMGNTFPPVRPRFAC